MRSADNSLSEELQDALASKLLQRRHLVGFPFRSTRSSLP